MPVICKFNKNGYCKHGTHCFRQHIEEICVNGRGSAFVCRLRHPKVCHYIFKYGYCKFGQYCRFDHSKFRKDRNKETNQLNIELEGLKIELEEKERTITEKDNL